MKYAFIFLTFPLLAEQPSLVKPPITQEMLSQTAAAKTASPAGSAVIMISPDARANDYKQAFDAIRKEKASANIIFFLKDGSSISNILDMTVMGKGTMILFRANSPMGIKIYSVNVEDIATLTHG